MLHEGQAVLADLELVAVLELGVVDPPPVDEGAVEGALVLDEERPLPLVEEDVAVRRASDPRPRAVRPERLAGAPAARADDQRRPLEALDRHRRELADLLRRERLRRLAAPLPLLEERTAARAVVGGLRVLEPALAAVDVAHELSSRAPTSSRAKPAWRARTRTKRVACGSRPAATRAASSSTSGSRSAGRRRPGRGRSAPRTAAGGRRAPRAGCRSSRAGSVARS